MMLVGGWLVANSPFVAGESVRSPPAMDGAGSLCRLSQPQECPGRASIVYLLYNFIVVIN